MCSSIDRNCFSPWCPAAIFWERVQLVQSTQRFCTMDVWSAKTRQLVHQTHQPAYGLGATFSTKSDILEPSCLPHSGESPGKPVYLCAPHQHISWADWETSNPSMTWSLVLGMTRPLVWLADRSRGVLLVIPSPAKAVYLQGCGRHVDNQRHSWLQLQWW